MTTSKKICKNGSLTLPKVVRAEAGLFPGNAIDITTNDDGSITIKPTVETCHFCGSPEDVIKVANISICKNCVTKILARVDVTDDD